MSRLDASLNQLAGLCLTLPRIGQALNEKLSDCAIAATTWIEMAEQNKARADKAEAEAEELRKDRDRLEYIMTLFNVHGAIDGCEFDTMDRTTIDAARKAGVT